MLINHFRRLFGRRFSFVSPTSRLRRRSPRHFKPHLESFEPRLNPTNIIWANQFDPSLVFTSAERAVINQDGNTIVWMTDSWLAQVVCKLLTDNEGLLRRKEEKDGIR